MIRVRLLLLLLCFPLIVGCEGCRKEGDEKEKDKKKTEEPLQEFTSKQSLAFPADGNLVTGAVKPGHWITASQSLKSNKVDVRGDLISHATLSRSNFLDGGGPTNEAESIKTERPIVLPKGQLRRFEFRLLPPTPTSAKDRRVLLGSRFVSSGRSTFFDTGKQPLDVMDAREYFFVVLTKRPERFARIQVADWVRPPVLDNMLPDERQSPNYRVVIPETKNVLALPETMLDLTNTAYILWDNLGPEALTPQQTTALADWIRFGGQLIVNGADGSDSLNKTALAGILPLTPTSNIELDGDAAQQMMRNWQDATDTTTASKIKSLKSQPGRISVDGKLNKGGEAIEKTANLVLAKRIGLGRVVQSRFDITSKWLQDWDSYDSFVNSVVLLRPHRNLRRSDDSFGGGFIVPFYPSSKNSKREPDAPMNTRLRINARDARLAVNINDDKMLVTNTNSNDPFVVAGGVSGVGGWNSSSEAIRACREILRDESGITIPDSSLIARSLGYYLLLLVPINYLIFRLMGRLEYAWLAVPAIALFGAIYVARVARLDIGFARSQSQMALLELQPDYHRGHISRVIAIYNSLSDNYSFDFKTYDGVAMPLADGSDSDGKSCVFKTSYNEGPSLDGLSIESNRIRMVHAEQIVDVGGSLRLKDDLLINETDQELLDAFVIRKDLDGNAEIATVGISDPGSSKSLNFQPYNGISISDELPMQSARLIRKLGTDVVMKSGTTRLVGRIDHALPGMTVTPSANQTNAQTIVLAHLQHAPLPTPKADLKLRSDFKTQDQLNR